MTDHGFIGLGFGSSVDEKMLCEIARKVSDVPGVIWVHHVKHVVGNEPHHNIIVEIDPRPGKYGPLLEKIQEIEVEGRRIHKPADVWIIQSSHKGRR